MKMNVDLLTDINLQKILLILMVEKGGIRGGICPVVYRYV